MNNGNHHSNDLFAGIREPIEIRRNILESSKDVIESLKKFQRFESLRNARHKEAAHLRQTVVDLNRLLSRLRAKLPKAKLKLEAVREVLKPKKIEAPLPQEQNTDAPKKQASEVDRLQSELDEIEAKLNELS